MSWLVEVKDLFDLSQRRPLTLESFFFCALPPVGLYYATNVLAVMGPRAFVFRLALLPVTLYALYRALFLDFATSLSPSSPDGVKYFNQGWILAMFTVFTRSLYRTFGSQPQRNSPQQPKTYKRLALDAADLTFGLRGLGWNLAADAKIPAHTRPLHPTSAWASTTLRSAVLHTVALDILQYCCQCFDLEGLGSTNGGSIYDISLEPPLRYLRSTTITFFNGLIIYAAIQIGHDIFALIAVLVLRVSSPADWPPIFDSPWISASLTELWAARWHQVFRQEFLALGGWPLHFLAGRIGGVLGVFSVSGILHFVGLWGMGMADLRVYCFFLMMGVCVVLEGLWKKVTGRRVGGWPGRIWAWSQILFWGHLYIEPWCQSGIMASVFVPTAMRPSVRFHRLIVDILHG